MVFVQGSCQQLCALEAGTKSQIADFGVQSKALDTCCIVIGVLAPFARVLSVCLTFGGSNVGVALGLKHFDGTKKDILIQTFITNLPENCKKSFSHRPISDFIIISDFIKFLVSFHSQLNSLK